VPSLLLFELSALVLGLLLGSFLNVCIARLPWGESIVRPRSHCPACGHAIRWYDNIPLLGFLLLRGKCRDCGARISWRYPLVELASGLWFLYSGALLQQALTAPETPGSSLGIQLGISATSIAILGFLLIGLAAMDWETLRLPDAFTITGIALGFFLVCTQAIFLNPGEDQVLLPAEHMRLRAPGSGQVEGNLFMTGPEALVFGRIAAIAGASLLLLAIRAIYRRLRGREGMGLGDVKLLAMIAAFLGFEPAMIALFVGVLAAAFYASVLLAARRAGLASRVPLGSFLCLGGLFAAWHGTELLNWYTAFFH
jgi:leader peptidase (prepilin peptidase)/N-methyltransferase